MFTSFFSLILSSLILNSSAFSAFPGCRPMIFPGKLPDLYSDRIVAIRYYAPSYSLRNKKSARKKLFYNSYKTFLDLFPKIFFLFKSLVVENALFYEPSASAVNRFSSEKHGTSRTVSLLYHAFEKIQHNLCCLIEVWYQA